MIEHRLAGIAGDESHPGFRTRPIQFLCQLSPAHVRHHAIGDSQMDG